MIDGLRPYPEVKSTGVSWLPAIPAHWDFRRAKRSFREVDDRSERGDERGDPDEAYGDAPGLPLRRLHG